MAIEYIYLVDDFPRTREDSDSDFKAFMITNHDQLVKWSKDPRAPTLRKMTKVLLEFYEENKSKFDKVTPKEFKYSDAFDKGLKTDDFSEWHELQRTGGTELERELNEYKEEHPDHKNFSSKYLYEMIWEVKYIAKIENGTLPPAIRPEDEQE